MTTIKERLDSSNGWQRIWLVLTVAGLLYFGVFSALERASSGSTYGYEYRSSVVKDLENPSCVPYTVKPMSELKEPAYLSGGGTCWYIYTNRSFNPEAKLPYTVESYDSIKTRKWWETFFVFMGFGIAGVLISSLLIYQLGRLLVWIVRGFKK